jgi:hypothetical protein
MEQVVLMTLIVKELEMEVVWSVMLWDVMRIVILSLCVEIRLLKAMNNVTTVDNVQMEIFVHLMLIVSELEMGHVRLFQRMDVLHNAPQHVEMELLRVKNNVMMEIRLMAMDVLHNV